MALTEIQRAYAKTWRLNHLEKSRKSSRDAYRNKYQTNTDFREYEKIRSLIKYYKNTLSKIEATVVDEATT